MNIDFPPSSTGIYNNAGSSRQLVNYMEHEDMKRIEHGLPAESFFNLTDDNIYSSFPPLFQSCKFSDVVS